MILEHAEVLGDNGVVIINTGRVVFRGPAKGIKLDDAIVSQHLGVF